MGICKRPKIGHRKNDLSKHILDRTNIGILAHFKILFFRKNCKLSTPLLIKYTKYFSQDKKSISIKIILFRFYSTSSHFYQKKSQAKSAKNYEANFNEISVLLLLHFSAIKEIARQPLNFIK